MLKLVVIAALLAAAAGMAYVRFTPSDPELWHVDPRAIPKPGKPNHWLVRPVGGDARPPNHTLEPAALAALIDRIATDTPRTERVAGSVASGHLTYLTRSKWIGFPDYTSFRVYSTETGASFAAFARSRFGHSDLGVNRDRLERWIGAIDAALAAPEAPD